MQRMFGDISYVGDCVSLKPHEALKALRHCVVGLRSCHRRADVDANGEWSRDNLAPLTGDFCRFFCRCCCCRSFRLVSGD